MIFLHRFLPIFLLPVGLTLLLLLGGLVFRRRAFIIGAGVLLYLSSTSLVSGPLTQAVEGGAVRIAGTDAPTADAIVVLSEGRPVAPGPRAISEWLDADRFFGGVELMQAGKAPLLVFTGGWSPSAPTTPLEGNILARYATAMGVPSMQIAVTGKVADTEEEAGAVAALLRQRLITQPDQRSPRVLLVTSAFHMQRARRLFEHEGMTVLPFPVDFKTSVTGGGWDVFAFLPTAAALQATEVACREMYGRLFYRLTQ